MNAESIHFKLERTAAQAARAAGRVLMHYFRGSLNVRVKKGAGLVSQADTEAEEAALKVLKKHFSAFGVLAEESSPGFSKLKGVGGEDLWIIDPLDGTTNFVHGFPVFCVSIAARWRGQTVAGVVYHPVLKELYSARLGAGATLNGEPMRVSKRSRLGDSLLSTGFTYRKRTQLESEIRTFGEISRVTRAVRRPGAAALDLAWTARGIFDGFWEAHLSPWDVAAGELLVREAGGRVSHFDGSPLDITSGQILASNGLIHASLKKYL